MEEAHATCNLAVAAPEWDSHLAPERDFPERDCILLRNRGDDKYDTSLGG